MKELGGSGWNKQTTWNRLDGMMPHLIPADAATGPAQDLVLYENAVIFAGPPGGQPAPDKMAFLQVPEMIKIGDTWKFVELPRAVPPDKPIVAAEGGIRSWLFRDGNAAGAAQDPELNAALKALADYDQKNAPLQVAEGKNDVARFHVGRIPLLRAVVKAAGNNAETQLIYNKQIVESLAAAYQTGVYPDGLKLLDGLIAAGGQDRLVRRLPQDRRRVRRQERRAGGQPDGQPEGLDGRPPGLPQGVPQVRRSPRCPAPARQRQRVQRRGGRGADLLHPSWPATSPPPSRARRPPAP